MLLSMTFYIISEATTIHWSTLQCLLLDTICDIQVLHKNKAKYQKMALTILINNNDNNINNKNKNNKTKTYYKD